MRTAGKGFAPATVRVAYHPVHVLWLVILLGVAVRASSGGDAFDWKSIAPSADLKYHECYGGHLQCARLELPMDWLAEDPNDARTVALAVVKLPAVVPMSDPAYAGPVFFNPGGPGGSSVAMALSLAADLRTMLDKPGTRHYDVVSFDTRGVGYSTPQTNCFPGNPLGRAVAQMEYRQAFGSRASRNASLPYALAAAKAFGERCASVEVLPYVSTPSVARDLVALVDKSEELRRHHLPKRQDVMIPLSGPGKTDLAEPRLQYIGFSYGTVLGNYFASLFPGRVGRMVLDGVADAQDYTTGDGWLTNILDTDRMYEIFFESCHDNSEFCALSRQTDTTPKDIQARVDKFIDSLDKQPRAAVVPGSGTNIVVTGTDVRTVVGYSFEHPSTSFSALAEAINEAISSGDLTKLAGKASGTCYPSGKNACPADPRFFPYNIMEGGIAVHCGDADSVVDKDVAWWQAYMDRLIGQSEILGQDWSAVRLNCAGWPVHAKWDFDGPFGSPEPDPAGAAGKPAAPILFVTSRWDPVTPLRAARNMAKGHAGSRVLVVETMGHCTLGGQPSKQYTKALAEYFDTGAVPEEQETTYEVDCNLWDADCKDLLSKYFQRMARI